MLTDELPFKGKTQEHTFELIKRGKYELTESVSEEGRDIIEKLLRLEPSERLGANDIQELNDHPFF